LQNSNLPPEALVTELQLGNMPRSPFSKRGRGRKEKRKRIRRVKIPRKKNSAAALAL